MTRPVSILTGPQAPQGNARTTRLRPDRRRAAGSGQGRRAIGSAGVTPHAIETSPAATPLRPRRASRRRAPACAAYVLNVKHRRMIRTRGRRSTRVGCAPPGFRRFRLGVFPRLDPGVERADECSRLMGYGLSSGYGVQDQVPARVRWRMSGCAAQLLCVAVERVDRTPDRRIGSRMSVAVVGRGCSAEVVGKDERAVVVVLSQRNAPYVDRLGRGASWY